MKRILFICMGNICRSPCGEGVMQKFIKDKNLEKELMCDSAGTISYHAGDPADARMKKHAQKRGYSLDSISRQIKYPEDYKNYDYIVVMDKENLNNVLELDQENQYRKKIFEMVEFCINPHPGVVPDPYYGGDKGFEEVIDIVEDGCQNMLDKIIKEEI